MGLDFEGFAGFDGQDDKKIVAVDFDGTLRMKGGVANEKMVKWTNRQYDDGHFIVIFTARLACDSKHIRAWLEEHGVKFDLISTDKIRFDVLVDDKSVHPDSLPEVP